MKTRRILLQIALTSLLMTLPVACTNQPENGESVNGTGQDVSQESQMQSQSETEEDSKDASKEASTEVSLPIEIDFPEEAEVEKAEDGVFAETPDYLLYAFELDTYEDGAVYDEVDIAFRINTKEEHEAVRSMLRLEDFTVEEGTRATIYENLNGGKGVMIPFSKMDFERGSDKAASGTGFTMIFGKSEGVGVYVVLGILKDRTADNLNEHDREVLDLMNNSALSLIPKEESDEHPYLVWEGSMKDGTELRLVYREGHITEVSERAENLALYFGEDQSNYFLIKHSEVRAGISAKDQLQALIDGLNPDENTSVSAQETMKGKMTYQKVELTYKEEGQDKKEILCLASTNDGSTWIVDLFGTASDVAAHEEDLNILLWSLEEE